MLQEPPCPRLVQLASRKQLSESEYAQLLSLLKEKRRMTAGPETPDEALLGAYSETIRDSRFINAEETPPDCLRCGACCSYFHQIPVQIHDATPRSMTWQVCEEDNSDEMPLYWLRRHPEDGDCLAFEGQVGGRAHCLIYELRPLACRAFEAGSDRCQALRRWYGLESGLTAAEKQVHLQILSTRIEANESGSEAEPDPALSPDEIDKSYWLGELIAYNLGKLEEITGEIDRLASWFDDGNGDEVKVLCSQLRQECIDNSLAISGTLAPLEITATDSELVFRELLQIGTFSQESVESAAHQLAQIGELAFEISGMKEAVVLRDREPL